MNFLFIFATFLFWQSSAVAMDFAPPICADKKECPTWIAQLQVLSPSPSVCSAFLIKPQLMVTNRHCLNESLRKPGSPCRGLQFSFPATPNFPSETIRCQSILDTSDSLKPPLKWIADMALIQLEKPVLRPHLEISNEELAGNETVDVFKVDPPPMGKNTSVVRKIPCTNGSSIVNLYFTQKPSPEMSLLKCPIISGNSGSPVLNSKGKAVGLIWARGGMAQPHDGSPSFEIGVGTPFQCFDFPNFTSLRANSVCRLDLEPKAAVLLEKDYTLARHETVEEAEQKSRMAAQLGESFKLLSQKFTHEMNQEAFSASRSLFSWLQKEVPLKAKSGSFFWGRYMLVPACVHRDRFENHLKESRLTAQNWQMSVPVPVANLIRVVGEPALYFTPLLENKDLKIKTDTSRAPATDKFRFSYQIEVAPQQIELAVVEIPAC